METWSLCIVEKRRPTYTCTRQGSLDHPYLSPAPCARICGHVELLTEAGYVEGIKIIRDSTGEYHWEVMTPRLTVAGHDPLDTMRSNTVWTTVKDMAKKKGIDLTFEVVKQLTGVALKQVLGG
ncbi:DUF2513 domain-containing protein [Herbaspirillum sp. C9C3]|uniref:DUF2513 domain-containing protein n=1 Tax=Herbaspirillum sp. C9C3 TaxID=2735271 RepID=UPI001584CF12|nr:DUF2513 domain-containing protein [Herbaspirillum sp. C9C3]NUT60758.1 DUF2513 domain-containing protein [Herbaspirillum sp. C9C3]